MSNLLAVTHQVPLLPLVTMTIKNAAVNFQSQPLGEVHPLPILEVLNLVTSKIASVLNILSVHPVNPCFRLSSGKMLEFCSSILSTFCFLNAVSFSFKVTGIYQECC